MTEDDPSSILEGGKLKPGIYKIQNLYHQNYLDVQDHSRQLWGRPARELEDGRGLWEIGKLGAGYTVKRVQPGKPDQFCNPMDGTNNGNPVYVAAYPIAWRVEVVDEGKHRGFEYIRFYWGTTKQAWDMCTHNRTKVQLWDDGGFPNKIWNLIPVKD